MERVARYMTRPVVRAQRTATTVLSGVGILWIVFAVDTLLGHALRAYGIHSRSWEGLSGIPFAPFLHADFAHLAMNSVFFVFLGGLLHLRRAADFAYVSIVGAIGSGLGAWLLSNPNVTTIGLSGVLFAYLGFLMTRGLFDRKLVDIVLSIAVTYLFGNMLFGVLPVVAAEISWQAHLAGFLTGVACATRRR